MKRDLKAIFSDTNSKKLKLRMLPKLFIRNLNIYTDICFEREFKRGSKIYV